MFTLEIGGKPVAITDAIYAAGYQSPGRFYEDADDVLGMTPTAYRDGGKGANIRFAIGECALGAILVACSERGICEITLGDDPQALALALQDRFPQARIRKRPRRIRGTVPATSTGVLRSPCGREH